MRRFVSSHWRWISHDNNGEWLWQHFSMRRIHKRIDAEKTLTPDNWNASTEDGDERIFVRLINRIDAGWAAVDSSRSFIVNASRNDDFDAVPKDASVTFVRNNMCTQKASLVWRRRQKPKRWNVKSLSSNDSVLSCHFHGLMASFLMQRNATESRSHRNRRNFHHFQCIEDANTHTHITHRRRCW